MNCFDLLPFHISKNEADDVVFWQLIEHWTRTQLAASDWTQLPDVDLPNKSDWAVYRQELRDMMNKGVPPKEIVFPTPPV